MVTVVSSGNLTSLVKIYYDKRLLERLTPQLMFHQFGVKKELPKHEGEHVYWHRWSNFGKGLLLAESGAGAGKGISAVRVSASLLLFGEHAKITSYLDMVSISSVVEGAIDLFADSAALTVDYVTGRLLLWRLASLSSTLGISAAAAHMGTDVSALGGVAHIGSISATDWQAPVWGINDLASRLHAFSGGTAAQLSPKGGGATGVCSVALSPTILRRLALKLRIKNAQPFEDGYFKCIIHPDKVHELRSSSAFIDLHKYTENMVGVMKTGRMAEGGEKGLVGVMESFKFYESTEAPLFSTSSVGGVPVYARAQPSAYGGGRYYFSFFFGKNAYGVTDFDGGVRTFIKTPGPQDTSNPLDLYSTVGYRCIMTAKVLNRSACLWLIQGRNATNMGEG